MSAGLPGCNLFVASLPPGTTDEILRQLFSEFGQISSSKVMIDLRTKQLRSHGFVRFSKPEAAQAAIAAMHRRKVHEAHPPIHVALATHDDAGRASECEVIYVRNLPDRISVEQLRQAFAVFGTIVDVTLPSSTNSMHQGVGFVRFSNVDEAKAAVTHAHNTTPFGPGRAIQVRFKESKQASVKRGHGRPGSPSGSQPASATGSPLEGNLLALSASPPLFNMSPSTHNALSPNAFVLVPLTQNFASTGAIPLLPMLPATAANQQPRLNSSPTASPTQNAQGSPLSIGLTPQTLFAPATAPPPFPSANDLYFNHFGLQDWLIERLAPWQPQVLQAAPDGAVCVRLFDPSLHYSCAQSLNGLPSPNGTALTAALLRL